MASTIKVKRSAVSGNAPNTSNIDTGELALNTADGILYSSDGSNVFEVGANLTSLSVTGQTNLSANVAIDTNVLFVDTVNNRVGINTTSLFGYYPIAMDMSGDGWQSVNILNTSANTTHSAVGIDFNGGTSGIYASSGDYTQGNGNSPALDTFSSSADWLHIYGGDGVAIQGNYSSNIGVVVEDANPMGGGVRLGLLNSSATGITAYASVDMVVYGTPRTVSEIETNTATYGTTRFGGPNQMGAWIRTYNSVSALNDDHVIDGLAIGDDAAVGIYHIQESSVNQTHGLGLFTGSANTFVEAVRINSTGTVTINKQLDVTGQTNLSAALTVTDGDITTSNGNITVDGNIGIGNISPVYKLDVADGDINVANGTILIEGSAGSAGQVLTSDGTSASWQTPAAGGGGFEQVFLLMGA